MAKSQRPVVMDKLSSSVISIIKIDVSFSVTYLSQASMFDQYVMRCGSKNIYIPNDHVLKEIGLQVQNTTTILSTKLNGQHC
jgi:hypothetical protein